MILGTRDTMKIGERLCGLRDGRGVWHAQPFVIIRKATYEEWKAQPENELLGCDANAREANFYEVSTD